MTDTLTTILSATLVTAGVLAEANLVRLIARDWRQSKRDQARRRLRPAATGQRQIASGQFGITSRRAVTAVLALAACPAIAQSKDGQQSASSPAPSIQASTSPVSVSDPSASKSESITPEPAPFVISTDRPSFSDTTGLAPLGHLQLETGYTFTFRNRDNIETQRHNGPEILARVGLIEDRLEVRASTSGYTWLRTDGGTGAGFITSEGFSDVSLGFKLKLTDQDGGLPRLAFEAVTTLGTGSRAASSRRAEPTIKLIWSYDLEKLIGEQAKGFGVYGNLNLAYPTTNGDRFVQGAGSICGTYAINDSLGVFAEYYVVGPAAKGTDAAHAIDFGASYLLNNRTQLDARIGFGLNHTADNMYVGLGISFLF